MTTALDRHALAGKEVAITGRLASMSRAEALERIASAGGTYVSVPRPTTALLVVGQDGPPLDERGRPTQSLLRGRAIVGRGGVLRIVSEEEFLAELGETGRRDGLQRLYTTQQLSRILEVPAGQIRTWVRHGLIRPVQVVRRLCFFDFRQVASARTLARLTREGVTPARIRKSLEALAGWLPEASGALAQLEVLELGGGVLVRTAEGLLAEPSGQLRLDFAGDGGREAAPIQPLDPRAPPFGPGGPAGPGSTDDRDAWFELGIRLEELGRSAEAIVAYERVIELGDERPEVRFNLGNAFYALGLCAEAAHAFTRATDLDPDYVEAWNNLGNVLAELGRSDGSLDAFRCALALEPDYADAHYNMAETLANLGDYAAAREHWRAYLRQDPASPWAEVVRERLRRTRGAAEPSGADEPPPGGRG